MLWRAFSRSHSPSARDTWKVQTADINETDLTLYWLLKISHVYRK